MKSFDQLANPHRYIDIPTYKRKPNRKSKPLPKFKSKPEVTEEVLEPCRVIPPIVHLYPKIIDNTITYHGDIFSYYTLLVQNSKKYLPSNIDLSYNVKNQ